LDFLSWLDLSGNGRNAEKALSAIRARWKDNGQTNKGTDPRIKSVIEGIKRKLKKDKVVAKERDPFVIDILVYHMNLQLKDKVWIRDACIVVIGFRAMRRASELCALKANDIILKNDMVVISIRKSVR